MKEIIKCRNKNNPGDCFGCTNTIKGSFCNVLSNTTFKGGQCPFYKTQNEFNKDIARYGYVRG